MVMSKMLCVVLRKQMSGKASQRVAFGVNIEGGILRGVNIPGRWLRWPRPKTLRRI